MYMVSWFHGERALIRFARERWTGLRQRMRWAYRCVGCGKVSDWVIEQNRQIAAKAVTANQRKGNARNEEAGAA